MFAVVIDQKHYVILTTYVIQMCTMLQVKIIYIFCVLFIRCHFYLGHRCSYSVMLLLLLFCWWWCYRKPLCHVIKTVESKFCGYGNQMHMKNTLISKTTNWAIVCRPKPRDSMLSHFASRFVGLVLWAFSHLMWCHLAELQWYWSSRLQHRFRKAISESMTIWCESVRFLEFPLLGS